MIEIRSEIDPQNIYSVSELNQEIKTLIETTIPVVWLEGEVSNLKFHSSGHVYFSLKDKDSQISAVIWKSRFAGLNFTPQDGMKVIVLGRVTVFHKRGSYQFDTIKMKPAGVGDLQLAFEQLKQKLLDEGLFDETQKKPIPEFPESIGIVTSETGAAIQDLYNVLNRRFPGIEIILNPVKVQGEGAAHEIALAVDEFNEFKKVDVLIVGRGGGSLEDLWAFNEEEVARAVFRSEIPVISAVGHEVDFTICDFVADLRAPTPSAAAELAVPDRIEWLERITRMKHVIFERSAGKIQYERERLTSLVSSYHFLRTPDIIKDFQQRVDELTNTMQVSFRHRISLLQNRVLSLAQQLQSVAPESVLKRGYSICVREKDGVIVKDANYLVQNDKIKVKFFKGSMSGIVEEINND